MTRKNYCGNLLWQSSLTLLAPMKIEAEGMLLFANDDDIRDFCRPIGGFVWHEDIVFDLSGEEAVITETHIGQDLIPNIAPPAMEPL